MSSKKPWVIILVGLAASKPEAAKAAESPIVICVPDSELDLEKPKIKEFFWL